MGVLIMKTNFKSEIAKLISMHIEMEHEEILNAIEVPPDTNMGDYAFPCFRLAKTMRKAPQAIAEDLATKMDDPNYKGIATGAYLNIFVNKTFFAERVLEEVLKEKESYGRDIQGNGKTIVIDYSSPNIAKPFHVGHLRSTMIGNALYQMYNFLGYNCISINHLGDWGTQFGKLIVAYKNWGDDKLIQQDGLKELTRIYVKFHDEAEKDATLDDEARSWLVKMQEGNEEALTLWKWFNDISLKDFNRIYELLNIKFDYYTGESFYNDKMEPVVEELRQKSLLTLSDGASVVELEEFKMPPCLILRRDGGTLYPTRDIAAAIYRKQEYDFDKCLYVTAFDQNLHFEQWFKVIELMKHDWSKNLIHIPFGLVSLEEGKLATRKGRVVLMEDLLNEAVAKTKSLIEEKNPDLSDKDEVAKQVGIGAVIFNDLYNNRIKDVVFSWERMLSFDGESGPYVQYTHARAYSLLEKAGHVELQDIDFSLLADEYSVNVIKQIAIYTEKVEEAVYKNEPYIVSRYLMELAQSFSKFYNAHHILNSEKDVQKSRLAVVYSVKVILRSGLELLGISAPNKM